MTVEANLSEPEMDYSKTTEILLPEMEAKKPSWGVYDATEWKPCPLGSTPNELYPNLNVRFIREERQEPEETDFEGDLLL